ncbi:MBL fold metallo-hydrolase [Candidatus Palauibacter polyketidifaciens]|uniref:MBL fold metallo-hydrolase n=1 Tax=Candidatus Palauibacter polyketidifaciens TaxID=3056740 RepID=UPI00139EE3A3|nr:MBL fold metallo-hydrolase [Candidatus Palauibacter polyketidifaciens]MDE2721262.1 MBL fold metallo-hydrolase [Candidatus Palauibacter polyketidifaciens]MYE35814.1 MBL fold metallo-hydrolase [Gemmatimonadales bacterium]
MVPRTSPRVSWLAIPFLASCGAPGDTSQDAATDAAAAGPETSDPYEHGFTDADYPRVIEVAEDVYAYEQIHPTGGEIITTVSLIVITSEGVLVADGQENPEETQRLVDTIAGMTDRPITHVVVASDHGDHTGGNSAFPAGARFLAHPTSAAILEESAVNPNRPEGAPPVIVPTEIVGENTVLELGGREIHLLHLGRAHTGGDLVVYVPEGKVLFMSETYLKHIFPAMRSAYPSEWVAMLDRALEMDVDIYIPGHGVMEAPEVLEAGLVSFREAVQRVVEEATRFHGDGLSAEEAAEAAAFGAIEEWSLRDSQKPRAIQRVYLELSGYMERNGELRG